MVGSSSRCAGSGGEGILKGREWSVGPHEESGGPPEGPGLIGKPSLRAKSGREAILVVREWSGGPTEGPGVVGRSTWRVRSLSWIAGSGRETLPKCRK